MLNEILKKCIFSIIIIITVCVMALINYKDFNEINYRNSDATWHMLLTIKAYDKTPRSIHKFLPIITLGNKTDKNISFGTTVQDNYGNFYYTSFSPFGFVLPYLFFKTTNINSNENGIYLFNSILLLLSALILFFFITDVFNSSKYKYFLALFAILLYISIPEVMHGMGPVYWHHSIMQVTLLLQIYAYYKLKNIFMKFAFFTLCIINPYIEWTGYIANIGFIISEIFRYNKKINKKLVLFSISVILLTLLSGILFCLHYISVIPIENFFKTCISRAAIRSNINYIGFFTLIKTYISSFKLIWVLLFLVVAYLYIQKGNIKNSIFYKHQYLLLVLIFPCLENIIMLNHSTTYTYDTMKLSFFLLFILVDLLNIIIIKNKNMRYYFMIIIIFIIIGNILLYNNSKNYVWIAKEVKLKNKIMVDYVMNNYYIENKTDLSTNFIVRGYLTLLFNHNIKELKNFDTNSIDKKIFIYIIQDDVENKIEHGLNTIKVILVYNKNTNICRIIKMKNELISDTQKIYKSKQKDSL